MDSLFNDMLSKGLVEVVARQKDGDLYLATLRELAERRNRLGKAMMAFVEVKTYNPDWLYWQDFSKANKC